MTSPRDPQANEYTHVRGTRDDLFDRLTVSELCKGWPVYRDASEWKNYRSLFAEDAYVWTTWSKRLHIDAFIAASKKGKAAGDFIMHRECGTLVDLNPATGRAVGKMKATITQRFRQPVTVTAALSTTDAAVKAAADNDNDLEYDVDCDCQFHFFCYKDTTATTTTTTAAAAAEGGPGSGSQWKVKYVKLIYSKDKVVPADGRRVPEFSAAELAPFPQGYKYLGAAQARLGHDMDLELPTPGDEARWVDLYDKMAEWLDGSEDVDLVGCGRGRGGGDGAVLSSGGAAPAAAATNAGSTGTTGTAPATSADAAATTCPSTTSSSSSNHAGGTVCDALSSISAKVGEIKERAGGGSSGSLQRNNKKRSPSCDKCE
ncbi:nuclear transport factor 2 family protein [Microdochium nivale]|nr:nuclear transport factor 2 family protein [Microdochium nivale]